MPNTTDQCDAFIGALLAKLGLQPFPLKSCPCHPKEASMPKQTRRTSTDFLREKPATVLETVIARQEPVELVVDMNFQERCQATPVAVLLPYARYEHLIGLEQHIKTVASSIG